MNLLYCTTSPCQWWHTFFLTTTVAITHYISSILHLPLLVMLGLHTTSPPPCVGPVLVCRSRSSRALLCLPLMLIGTLHLLAPTLMSLPNVTLTMTSDPSYPMPAVVLHLLHAPTLFTWHGSCCTMSVGG